MYIKSVKYGNENVLGNYFMPATVLNSTSAEINKVWAGKLNNAIA